MVTNRTLEPVVVIGGGSAANPPQVFTLDFNRKRHLVKGKPHLHYSSVNLAGAIYDKSTRWPPGFDATQHGARLAR
jgi:hypothetical protein